MKKRIFCAHCGSDDLSVYYPTPEAVGREVIEQAEIENGLEVLEPSAGSGDLAHLAVAAGATVDCIELQPNFAETLRSSGEYRNVWAGNFLSMVPQSAYDRIIMNPPFEHGADMDHVERAFDWLKPGGILVAVMSAMSGKRRGRKDRAFAGFLDAHSTITTPLPEKAFSAVGTNVRCVSVRVEGRR